MAYHSRRVKPYAKLQYQTNPVIHHLQDFKFVIYHK